MTRFVSRSVSRARVGNGIVLGVAMFAAMSLLSGTLADASPAPLHLGTTRTFAVLASDGITNIGATTITGNVGSYPNAVEKGFGSVTLHGKNHLNDAAAAQAQTSLVFAYNDAVGRTALNCTPNQLGGTTKLGYTYCVGGNAVIGGTLTLDAQGHPNAVFIFQVRGGLITQPDSKVKLVHGANACNVYWVLGTSATLNPGSQFVGTILARGSITATAGVRVSGRLFSRQSTITLVNTVVSKGKCT